MTSIDFAHQLSNKRDNYIIHIQHILNTHYHLIYDLIENTKNEIRDFGFKNNEQPLATRITKIESIFNFISGFANTLFYLPSPTFSSFCGHYDTFDELLNKHIDHIQPFKSKKNIHSSVGNIDVALWGLRYTLNQFDTQLNRLVTNLQNDITLEFYNIMDEYI